MTDPQTNLGFVSLNTKSAPPSPVKEIKSDSLISNINEAKPQSVKLANNIGLPKSAKKILVQFLTPKQRCKLGLLSKGARLELLSLLGKKVFSEPI
jgi:hypothetical protein